VPPWERKNRKYVEAAGTHDEASLKIASGDQLLHQQPGHDGFSSARIVG